MDLIERCYTLGWTDGLPVVPPTPSAVNEMLGERAGDRHEVVALLEPSGAPVTLEKIAANAVMAGCLPIHLPVLEAAVRAAADPALNTGRLLTTASSQKPMVFVSGPVVATAGISGGSEALGSRARANATIGRALSLILANLASLKGSARDHATLGQPAAHGFCFSENLVDSPWPPWHTDRGYAADRSLVTLFAADSPLIVVDMGRTQPEKILRTIAESIAIPGTYAAYFREDLWLVMSPQHAAALADGGWTRPRVAEFLFERARLPARRLLGRGLYGYLDDLIPPVWLSDDTGDVSIVDDPDRINIAVAGGPFGGYTAALFGEGPSVTADVTLPESQRCRPVPQPRSASRHRLIDPTAAHAAPRQLAPGLRAETTGTIGLVDSMLHKQGMWGIGLLDAAERALRKRVPNASFSRFWRDPLDREMVDHWATAMAARYEALVFAAGD